MNIYGRINLLNIIKKSHQESFVTLYHITKHGPGKPHPASRRPPDNVWNRPWLDEPYENAIFLTPNPAEVYIEHGIRGEIYTYSVHKSIIKESQGIHLYDSAHEIAIPKDIWKKGLQEGKIIFLGKKSKTQFEQEAKEQGYIVTPGREKITERLHGSKSILPMLNNSFYTIQYPNIENLLNINELHFNKLLNEYKSITNPFPSYFIVLETLKQKLNKILENKEFFTEEENNKFKKMQHNVTNRIENLQENGE